MSETTNYRLAGILWLTSVITVFASLVIVLQYDITLNPADIEKALVNVNRFADHSFANQSDDLRIVVVGHVSGPPSFHYDNPTGFRHQPQGDKYYAYLW